MNTRAIINKVLVLSVFVIAGYLLARSMYYGSFVGILILLAMVAMAAWTLFLYQLSKAQTKVNTADESNEDH